MDTVLYLVVPCYNEEDVLHDTSVKLLNKLLQLIGENKISNQSRIVFVDDGSNDKTWELIETYHRENSYFSGIKLSRNKGHQNALLGGLMTVKDKCDITISLDADLQDDINAIDSMVDKYNHENCEIVYGVRSSRKKDTIFKRTTAVCFYKLMKAMGVDIIFNHADFRLMSSKALNALEQYKEVNLFLRGLVPLVGFKSDKVTYERGKRLAGKSKYPLKKMVAFSLDGITSFSIKPIRMITTLGVIIFLASIAFLIYSFIRYFMGQTTMGWSSMFVSIWAIGGLQLLAIGIIGEYIGKIYLETKNRPRFIIDEFLNKENDSE